MGTDVSYMSFFVALVKSKTVILSRGIIFKSILFVLCYLLWVSRIKAFTKKSNVWASSFL